MKKKRRGFTNFILVLIFLAGLSLLLYPSFSNYWNSFHATRVIADYASHVAKLDKSEYEKMHRDAVAYNEKLAAHGIPYHLSDTERIEYESTLNVYDGIMGYIEISKLHVNLPIYHGTDDMVLQIAVGHLDWSSLPVGGPSTHSVLSGHRGLPSARLFTDLDQMREGDTFTLNILDEVLTYEVDQIRIVEPEVVSDLNIEEGEDYCTLVTCTPYGINTHRLLVRGHRIPTVIGNANVVSEAIIIEPLLVAPIVAIPILLALLIIVLTKGKNEKKRKHSMENGGIANE